MVTKEVDPGTREVARFTVAGEDLGVIQHDGYRTTEPGTFELTVGDLSTEFEVTSRSVIFSPSVCPHGEIPPAGDR